MADFKTHVSTSTVLGFGYAGVGHVTYGVPLDTAIVGGALCGFAGMLPDLDSDYGVPLRETMAFMAAIVPMFLVGRLEALNFSYDAMVLTAVAMYLFVRFGMTNMIRKFTVHRGMFHSIPAGLIFAGVAFLIVGASDVETRYYKAGAVLAGFLSHLLLDEFYSIEVRHGRMRFKKSFGTALKFWGHDSWANFSTYSKLVVVGVLILGEPAVMERLETRNPRLVEHYRNLQGRIEPGGTQLPQSLQGAWDTVRTAGGQFLNGGGQTTPPSTTTPQDSFQHNSPPPVTIRRDPY